MQGFRQFNRRPTSSVQHGAGLSFEFHRVHTHQRRQQTTTTTTNDECTLYTYPNPMSLVPVLTPIDLTWDSTCLSSSSSSSSTNEFDQQLDILLSVVTTTEGSLPVHLWQNVNVQDNSLTTTLNPTWWNASTGSGRINAHLTLIPSGNPIWNTPVSTGPSFVIYYNGSYPSLTNSGPLPAYTGPSVESVNGNKTNDNSLTGGKLAAAVTIPLLMVIVGIVGFLLWNKWKKKPQQKRWSNVVDERMSMVSHGTWIPHRSSIVSRPGSFHPIGNQSINGSSIRSGHSGRGHRLNGSIKSSPLSNSTTIPEMIQTQSLSNLILSNSNSVENSNNNKRTSRVSFVSSMGGGGGGGGFARDSIVPALPTRPHSIHTTLGSRTGSDVLTGARSIQHRTVASTTGILTLPTRSTSQSQFNNNNNNILELDNQKRMKRAESDQTVYHSARSVSNSSSLSSNSFSQDSKVFKRSETIEQLDVNNQEDGNRTTMSNSRKARLPGGNAFKSSIASSLRNDLQSMEAVQRIINNHQDQHQRQSLQVVDMPQIPRPSLQLDTTLINNNRRSIHEQVVEEQDEDVVRSPDEALASYAASQAVIASRSNTPIIVEQDEQLDLNESNVNNNNRLTRFFKSLKGKKLNNQNQSSRHHDSSNHVVVVHNHDEKEIESNQKIDYSVWQQQFKQTGGNSSKLKFSKQKQQHHNDIKQKRKQSIDERDSMLIDSMMDQNYDFSSNQISKSPFDDPSTTTTTTTKTINNNETMKQSIDIEDTKRLTKTMLTTLKPSFESHRSNQTQSSEQTINQKQDPYALFDQESQIDFDDDDVEHEEMKTDEESNQVGMAL
ncbi:hypothetical protein OIO90_002930 [Microbotryomycetes sp. JL221]|nr:hypothetical protein OIO90_002930 [Microbotryomycetes sp. JL221]